MLVRPVAHPSRSLVVLSLVALSHARCAEGASGAPDDGSAAAGSGGTSTSGPSGPSASGPSASGPSSSGSESAGTDAGGAPAGGAGGDGGQGGDGAGGAESCVGPSGVHVGPVQISDEPGAIYPAVLEASDAALAVAWIATEGPTTSTATLRLIDRETLEPQPGPPQSLAPAPLHGVASTRLVPSPEGFALSFSRTFTTTQATTCHAYAFDEGALAVGSASLPSPCHHPSLVHDGAGWGLFHVGSTSLDLRLLEETGDPLASQIVDADAGANGSASAFNPASARYVAAYTRGFPGGDEEIVTAEVTLAGEITSSGVRVSNAPGASRFPEIARHGAGFGVIWEDHRSGGVSTFFSALDGSGAPVGGEIEIAPGGFGARLASSGDAYGVVWTSEAGEVLFKSIDLAGSDVGGVHTLTTNAPLHTVGPNVTWDGERWIAVWFEDTQGPGTEHVFAAALCP